MNNTKIDIAYDILKKVVVNTPLVNYSSFFDYNAYFKLENLQKTGSFKLRGAYNKIYQLSDSDKKKGIICASAGNHAQGVAFSAAQQNIQATIVMPKMAPIAKIQATKAYGVKVILYGNNFDECYQYAKTLQKQNDFIFIEPFDDEDVIAGQATIAIEIINELSKFDYILVPIGGGGLISGIATIIKEKLPKTKIIGVQAKNAASMHDSIRNHQIVELESSDTFADGIAVKKAGSLTYELCKKYVDDIILVNEVEINHAVLFAIEKFNVVIEGAAAVGLAALLSNKLKIKSDETVVTILSGGNIDSTLLGTLIENGLKNDNRRITFGTVISDKPGQLNKLLTILNDKQANLINVMHDRYHPKSSAKTCFVELTIDTIDQNHIDEIIQTLISQGYDYLI